VGRAT